MMVMDNEGCNEDHQATWVHLEGIVPAVDDSDMDGDCPIDCY